MRKIILNVHITVDGVMQAPGGPEEDTSGGFTQGGWSRSFGDAASGEALREMMSSDFDLLLGRRTYELFAGYWPKQDHWIARAFDKATKYVATRTLNKFDWQNSEKISGDIVSALRQMKASEGPELQIWGSGDLLQTLIAADLIDEYRMFCYPVVLGEGKRLFRNSVPPRRLALIATQSTPKGIVINTYHPDGEIPPVETQPRAPEAEL